MVIVSLTQRCCDLNDMTLADEMGHSRLIHILIWGLLETSNVS